jgi:hypothetical protein
VAGALGDAAMRLAVQDQRIDRAADIVDRAVARELDFAGFPIDLDFGDMEAVREGGDAADDIASAVERSA